MRYPTDNYTATGVEVSVCSLTLLGKHFAALETTARFCFGVRAVPPCGLVPGVSAISAGIAQTKLGARP